jgi:hypothetical protein
VQLQDLEEVEEWNEYGELKEHVEPAGTKAAPASTPTLSAANTPSKPSATSSTPFKTSPAPIKTTAESPRPTSSTDPSAAIAPSTTTEAPLTTALRQAGFEAAKKATDAKSKARKDALEAAKAKDDSLQKLNNSGPTGMPPPSGITEAEDAIEPETAGAKVEGKADRVPVTGDGVTEAEDKVPSAKKAEKGANTATMDDQSEEVLEGIGQAEPPAATAQDIPSLASPPPADEVPSASEVEAAANESIAKDKSHIILKGKREVDRTPPSEREYAAEQEASDEVEPVGKTPLKQVTATDEAQDLPGKKTQDQETAKGDEAGNSVAD